MSEILNQNEINVQEKWENPLINYELTRFNLLIRNFFWKLEYWQLVDLLSKQREQNKH